MASSTSEPMAMAIPPRLIVLIVKSHVVQMPAVEAISDRGSVTSEMISGPHVGKEQEQDDDDEDTAFKQVTSVRCRWNFR